MASIPSSSDQILVSNSTVRRQQEQGSSSKLSDEVEMLDKMPVNGMSEVQDKKPDVSGLFRDMDTAENIQKFERYHADYTRYLKAKYFAGKNLFGGNIFEKEVTVDNVTIKASRWPSTRSFTDPIQSFEDHIKLSPSTTKAPISLPNRKKCSS